MNQTLNQKFFRYVFSSMITMLLQSLYSMIDGLFVSNLVGDYGLSAINVVWPMIAVITATGTGIGCGGSVIMSTMQGADNTKESDRARANVLVLLAIFSLLITVSFLWLLPIFLKQMGATGKIYESAMVYGRIMIGGSVIQIFSTGLTPLLRNDNRAVTAMNIMVAGLLSNLIFNYILMKILTLGIMGSAAGSLMAQALTVAFCFYTLLCKAERPLSKEQFSFHLRMAKKILKTGISPFGISLTPSLIIMYHNIQCIRYGGDTGIAIFSLITSTIGSYRILLIGVAEGIQPLASFAAGACDYASLRKIRRKGLLTAILVSLILFVFTLLTASYYAPLYGFSKSLEKASYHALLLSATQLLFTGIVRVSNSFFYAIGLEKYALFLIYFDPLIMMPLLITLMPHFFGLNGIWLTMTISQLILSGIAFIMYQKQERRWI